MIARALNDNKYALVVSLDLTFAFDVVVIGLLLKRLKIIGLLEDITKLISEWLKERFYYVSVDGQYSIMLELLMGMVQGSILGSILYTIFV
jgi:hypothetical protein